MGEKIFCIHGGLSPEMRSMKQIENIKRPCEVPEYGMLCDFLWVSALLATRNAALFFLLSLADATASSNLWEKKPRRTPRTTW